GAGERCGCASGGLECALEFVLWPRVQVLEMLLSARWSLDEKGRGAIRCGRRGANEFRIFYNDM
ncbi:MAG: hypothetical protein ACRYGR_09955, partial [Janthinobacterium lividum]